MKKLLLLALLLFLPTKAHAQCNGNFSAGSVCGTNTGGPPGQVALSVLTNIIYPTQPPYNAKCDSVTDDTTALQAMTNAILATNGNTTISFPTGKTCLIYNSGQAVTNNPLANWTGVNNVRILGNGATLQVGHTFTTETLNLFDINNSAYIWIDGLNVAQTVPVSVTSSSPSGTNLLTCSASCTNITLTNSILTGTQSAVFAVQTANLFVDNVKTNGSYYGVILGDAATSIATRGVLIRGLNVFNAARSLFLQGVFDADISLVSQNPNANDILITSDRNNGLNGNIRLNYKVVARTSGTDASYLTIGNSQAWNTVTNSIYRNITVNLDLDLSGDVSVYPAVQLIKSTTSSLGNTYENITIGGIISGVPAAAGNVIDLFTVADQNWSGETANNISLQNLLIAGSTTPAFYVDYAPFIASSAGALSLNNVLVPGNYTDANNSNVGTIRSCVNANFANLNCALYPSAGGTGLYQPTAHSILQSEGPASFSPITAVSPGNIIVDQGSGLDWHTETVTGDCTLAASGAITCLKTNGSIFTIYSTATLGQLPGTATNDNATAGKIGEYITSTGNPGFTTTVSITNASPAVITWTANGFSTTQTTPINFTTTGALPTGLTVGITYWVIPSTVTTNTLEVATSAANAYAGTPVNTSSNGSGTQTGINANAMSNNTTAPIGAIQLTAGDWSCQGNGWFNPTGGATMTVLGTSLNANPTTLTSIPDRGFFQTSLTTENSVLTPTDRFSLSGTTIEYLTGFVAFAADAVAASGQIFCRRTR